MSEDQGGPPEEIPLAAPGVEIPPEPEPVLLPFAAHVIDAAGLIVNQVMVTSLDAIPGLVDASIGGRIGDSVIDGALVPAPASEPIRFVPRSVTMRQARLALLYTGMLDAVDEALDQMPGVEGEAARIEWKYSQEVQRYKSLVGAMAQVLELTEIQLDDLFVWAATL